MNFSIWLEDNSWKFVGYHCRESPADNTIGQLKKLKPHDAEDIIRKLPENMKQSILKVNPLPEIEYDPLARNSDPAKYQWEKWANVNVTILNKLNVKLLWISHKKPVLGYGSYCYKVYLNPSSIYGIENTGEEGVENQESSMYIYDGQAKLQDISKRKLGIS